MTGKAAGTLTGNRPGTAAGTLTNGRGIDNHG